MKKRILAMLSAVGLTLLSAMPVYAQSDHYSYEHGELMAVFDEKYFYDTAVPYTQTNLESQNIGFDRMKTYYEDTKEDIESLYTENGMPSTFVPIYCTDEFYPRENTDKNDLLNGTGLNDDKLEFVFDENGYLAPFVCYRAVLTGTLVRDTDMKDIPNDLSPLERETYDSYGLGFTGVRFYDNLEQIGNSVSEDEERMGTLTTLTDLNENYEFTVEEGVNIVKFTSGIGIDKPYVWYEVIIGIDESDIIVEPVEEPVEERFYFDDNGEKVFIDDTPSEPTTRPNPNGKSLGLVENKPNKTEYNGKPLSLVQRIGKRLGLVKDPVPEEKIDNSRWITIKDIKEALFPSGKNRTRRTIVQGLLAGTLSLAIITSSGYGIFIFYIRRKKIRFHGVLTTRKLKGIIETGHKIFTNPDEYYIENIVKDVNEGKVKLTDALQRLLNCSTYTYLPADAKMEVYVSSDENSTDGIYSYIGKADESFLFEILSGYRNAVITITLTINDKREDDIVYKLYV